jgi:ABC-type uncharacterized transport system permease subunit
LVDLFYIVAATLSTSPPIIIASLGMLFAEKVGEFNIGMEGIMLTSATSTYIVEVTTKNLPLTIIIGPIVGAVFGIALSFLQIRFRVDQIILGIGVILLGIGLDPYLAGLLPQGVIGSPVPTLPRLSIPFLSGTPALVLDQNIVVYLAIIAIPAVWVITKKTFFGLKMAAVGENPKGSDVVGVEIFKVKFLGLLTSCVLGGFAGSYFIYGLLGGWIVGITGGTGFLAIAIVRIGNWNPLLVGAYAIFISGLFSFQFLGELVLANIPSEFFLALSYVLSIVAITIVNVTGRKHGPGALGIGYKRE